MTGFPGRLAFAKNQSTPPRLQSGMVVMLEKLWETCLTIRVLESGAPIALAPQKVSLKIKG